MFRHLKLERPLALLDLETTGVDPQKDRIVEISVLRFTPPDKRVLRTRRLNPGMPIPPAATAVHGIVDADVADKAAFLSIAPDLLRFLDSCDLCGYNLKRFDLRMLYAEFGRAGLTLDLDGRSIIDPMQIFHHYERRDLAAAVQFYLGRDHENGHAAKSDVEATAEVLAAMLDRYDDLPRSVDGLHKHFMDPGAVDLGERFTRVEGEIRFRFGKYRGQPLDEVARSSPDYLKWMLAQDFGSDAKAVVTDALKKAARCVPVRGN
jgi:DNA polymerase III subunit epsilon